VFAVISVFGEVVGVNRTQFKAGEVLPEVPVIEVIPQE
jgi:hypothetical protein